MAALPRPPSHLWGSCKVSRGACRPAGAAAGVERPACWGAALCTAWAPAGVGQLRPAAAVHPVHDACKLVPALQGRQGSHPRPCEPQLGLAPVPAAAMLLAACRSTATAVSRPASRSRQQHGARSRAACSPCSAAAWLHRPRSCRRLQVRQARQTRGPRRWRGAAAASAAFGDSLFSSSERLRVLTK